VREGERERNRVFWFAESVEGNICCAAKNHK
jgi:hypothetical protein